jgi:hypothetical protein
MESFFNELSPIKRQVAQQEASPSKSVIATQIEDFFSAQMKKINDNKFEINDMLAVKAVNIMTKTAISASKADLEIRILKAKLKSM